MSIKLKKPQGTASVTQAMVDGKSKTTIAEETTEEKVDPPPTQTGDGVSYGQATLEAQEIEPYAEIQVDASFTKNLGNFQSAKVGVSLKMPARLNELDETFAFTRDWVNAKLEGIIGDLG